MYTRPDFKTKKELKLALASGKSIQVYDHSGREQVPTDGIVYLEGPHYPKPHTWYARGRMVSGKLTEVK